MERRQAGGRSERQEEEEKEEEGGGKWSVCTRGALEKEGGRRRMRGGMLP